MSGRSSQVEGLPGLPSSQVPGLLCTLGSHTDHCLSGRIPLASSRSCGPGARVGDRHPPQMYPPHTPAAAGQAYEWETGQLYDWSIAPPSPKAEPRQPSPGSTIAGTATMTPAAISGAATGTAADAVATSGDASGSGAEPAGARAQQQYTFEVFTVSAVDCQKLEGVRNTDGPPTAFSIAEETEIPALRCVRRSLGHHRHRDGPKSACFYMHDHDMYFRPLQEAYPCHKQASSRRQS